MAGPRGGEWPGAVSAMFTDRFTALPLRRRVVDAPFKHGAPEGLARNGFGRYFTDPEGLTVHEGKKLVSRHDGKADDVATFGVIRSGSARNH
ncbi:unnamed protein product [Durusdinium trenchii]|uniref:Uncharacterized protein n=1 Tax=Durusdinium trenchii TaxID=1381693 RepID=A0ABP0RXX2_9DINO